VPSIIGTKSIIICVDKVKRNMNIYT
jgi:hypothetical protein